MTNLITNKIYIGLTTRELDIRIRDHYDASKNKNFVFMRALRKYKKEDWKWEIIDNASTIEELEIKEVYWIKFFNSLLPNGYNSKEGGSSAKLTEEIKNKISNTLTGKYHTEETKQKMSNSRMGEKNPFYGKKHPPELCEKFSKQYTGQKLPKEQVEKSAQNHKKRIIDLTTNKIYLGFKEAAEKTGMCKDAIWKHCKNLVKVPRFQYYKEEK